MPDIIKRFSPAQEKINDPAQALRDIARSLFEYRDAFQHYHPSWALQADEFDRMGRIASGVAKALAEGDAA